MPDISGLNGGVVKATPDGTDLLPIQEVGGLTKPVSIASVAIAAAALVPIATPSAAGRMSAADKTKLDGLTTGGSGTSGSSPWTTKTANYTAIAGEKLRLDATAGDVVITLPASPIATDADILFQRLDLGTNKVLLRTGANKFNTQANQDAVFAPATINLIEGISYVNSAIGWLNQHNRLSFQAYTAPISSSNRSSLILNCRFDGANGSTTFTDDYGATIARATTGNTAISTAQTKFGTGSLYIDGTALVISDSVGKDKYNFPGQYTVQAWVYIGAGVSIDPTNGVALLSRCDNVSGRPTEYAFTLKPTLVGMFHGVRGASEVQYSATIPALSVGWNHIAFTRDASNVMRFFANGVLGTGTNSTPTDATPLGNSANQVYIGGFFPPYVLCQGLYIDSLEVDNVCLYNAVFTPPVAPTSAP